MATKLALLFTFLSISFLAGAQETDVLTLKDGKYHSEQNILDKNFTLVQQVLYDVPGSIDEEYNLLLYISFPDAPKARQLKTLDVKDSSLIKVRFDIFSVWNWEEENTATSGHITILSWTSTSVRVNFDLIVQDNRRKREYVYRGTRTFIRTKKKLNA